MLIRDVLSVFVPAIGFLFVRMALIRWLVLLVSESNELDRKFQVLFASNNSSRMSLQRPDYRPRWRFPFRTLRTVSLWVILIVLVSRSHSGCTPEPQPTFTVSDCAHDDSRFARIRCVLVDRIERMHR